MIPHPFGFMRSGGAEQLIPFGDGTIIGTFTNTDIGNSESDGFNGVTDAPVNQSARTDNSDTGFYGKDWGASVTHRVTRAIYYGPNNGGIQEGRNSMRIRIQEHDSAPVTGLEGTTIGDTGIFDGSPSSTVKDIPCTGGTQKRYHWALCTDGTSSNKWACAELEIYATD